MCVALLSRETFSPCVSTNWNGAQNELESTTTLHLPSPSTLPHGLFSSGYLHPLLILTLATEDFTACKIHFIYLSMVMVEMAS